VSSREPSKPDQRDGDRYAPRPPSERAKEPEPPRGVGLFRFTGWGWGFTIAIFLFIGGFVLLGYLRDDPVRNPAPAAYRTAVCAAFDELSEGTQALARGVAAGDDADGRAEAAAEVERRVDAANQALAGLPEWVPGRSLDALLGSQIITLTNGAAALAEGPAETDLAVAEEVEAAGREQLSDNRYGFGCST
jgi:hypothetical protein